MHVGTCHSLIREFATLLVLRCGAAAQSLKFFRRGPCPARPGPGDPGGHQDPGDVHHQSDPNSSSSTMKTRELCLGGFLTYAPPWQREGIREYAVVRRGNDFIVIVTIIMKVGPHLWMHPACTDRCHKHYSQTRNKKSSGIREFATCVRPQKRKGLRERIDSNPPLVRHVLVGWKQEDPDP